MSPREAIEQAADGMTRQIEAAMNDFKQATGFDVEVIGNSSLTTTYNKPVTYKLRLRP